jgi:DNA-binding LytR/AlgR family response regulator
MKLNCLLVDDEPPALEVLSMHIANIPWLEVAGTCHNAVEALDLLDRKAIDLIFLDIKMPKILGTDFLRNLPQPPKVIIVTAYREFALDGYELDVVDYLVKPVSFERFLRAVSKARRLMGHETPAVPQSAKVNSEAFVYLRVDKNMQKVLVNDILYIESWKDYVRVYLKNGKSLLARQSITATENLLSEYKFLRIHRSFIVSLDKVTGYTNIALIVEGRDIPIGRLYKQTVMDTLKIS